MRKHPSEGRALALRPFQNMQIDYTEFPKIQRWKYLLVIADHFTHWVKAFPTSTATTSKVAKMLLEQIIPRYGIIERTESDERTHLKNFSFYMCCIRHKLENSYPVPPSKLWMCGEIECYP